MADQEKMVKDIVKGIQRLAEGVAESQQQIVELLRENNAQLQTLNQHFNSVVALIVAAAAEEGIELPRDLEGNVVPQESSPLAGESGLG